MGRTKAQRFVSALAACEVPPDLFNQYAPRNYAGSLCRKNLTLYLRQMQALKPSVLLVGEAPSYRGARLTGVPFASEHVLVNGLAEFGLFGSERGYRGPSGAGRPGREASATIVWEVVSGLPVPPLIWNAVPFHPHQPGSPATNRMPSASELALCRPFLEEFITWFKIQQVIAVGRVAERTLASLGLTCEAVRHPSQGGKRRFVAGLRDLLASENNAPTRAGGIR